MKLAIGIVHGDRVDGWFHDALVDLLTQRLKTLTDDLLPLWDVIHVRSGPDLPTGRGLLVDTFLDRSQADVLLMLDSDMSFTAQTVYQMWQFYLTLPAHARVFGGLAFIASAATPTQPGFIQPNLWVENPDTDGYLACTDYPRNSVCDVAATGAACLMVHREVFEKVAAEQGARGRWFYRHELDDGTRLGEDLSFCRRVRAAGYPILLHTGLQFGHTKPMVISERDYTGGTNA